jgi:hypothetical protein
MRVFNFVADHRIRQLAVSAVEVVPTGIELLSELIDY